MDRFAVPAQRVIADGTMRLLHTQNSDGGWEWNNPDTDPSTGVPSPANTIGVTAMGVLDAYDQVGNGNLIILYQALMQVCRPAYELMVANAGDPDPSKHRVRGPDIHFLADLSVFLQDVQYADFAKTRWESAKTEFGAGTAAGFAQYIRDARKSQGLPALISWDINLYIQGVLALHRLYPNDGYDVEAQEMAEVIYTSLYVSPVDFDMSDQNQAEYWAGISGVMDAFVSAGVRQECVPALAAALQAGQQTNGRWIGVSGGSDVQTTAYAILALVRAGYETTIAAAVDYIVNQQLTNGGFEYDGGTENTEVTSEAIQAVYAFLS